MIARREIETEGVGHKSSNSDIPTLKTRPSPEAPSSNPHSFALGQTSHSHNQTPDAGSTPPSCSTYRNRRPQALREQLDTLQPKVLARSIRIALDDGLGMLQAWQPQIIPARITNTEPATRPKRINRPGKILPGEIAHDDARIVRTPGHGPVLKLCLRRALVHVALRHEHRERDVVGADAAPGDVLRESQAPFTTT